MEKYNVFKLYVIKYDDIFYICCKENEKYIDIFFNEMIDGVEDVQYLSNYYMVETMQKLARGEEFYLTKKELLIKFAQLNAYNLRKNMEEKYPWDIIKQQEEYLEAFKELSEKIPDIAKKIAKEKLKKLNLNYEE